MKIGKIGILISMEIFFVALIHATVYRHGISEAELNKFLEKVGLRRVRVRMQCVIR